MIKKERVLLLILFFVGTFATAMAQSNNITLKFNNEALSNALQRLEKASGYKIMFTYEDIQQYRVDGQVTNVSFEGALQYMLNNKLLAAGLDASRYSPHKLRHTAATLALESGADLKQVQQLLGHKDPSTTMKFYAGVTEEAQRRPVEGIESIING